MIVAIAVVIGQVAAGRDVASAEESTLKLRRPSFPSGTEEVQHPIDRFFAAYDNQHGIEPGEVVSDRVFARRVSLDLIGLLPTPDQIDALEKDQRPDKRQRFIESLLADREEFATHWLTLWNDALRNAYRGTGFIDGGRKQITGWLYGSLYENKPYDEFVHELVSPVAGSDGFLWGIKWRGVVNESQRREIQAAQNIAQVFLGTNLKCASCHDSFVNDWQLTDAYAFSSIFAEMPLEIHRCDQPTGETSAVGFLYPKLGNINAAAPRKQRLEQLAELLTKRENGRLARTIVNRLWAQMMGRGLIEPLDDMDGESFHSDLLEYLAWDLLENDYDLKHTLNVIATSRAYQLPAVAAGDDETEFVFRGPLAKRMTAEQFNDAVRTVTGVWPKPQGVWLKPDGRGQGGQLTAVTQAVNSKPRRIRAALTPPDTLQSVLGRPNREQPVTRRESRATMLQALELTNGQSLDELLRLGAKEWHGRHKNDSAGLIEQLFLVALGREPTSAERELATELLGTPVEQAGVQDLLWVIVLHPEFQLVY